MSVTVVMATYNRRDYVGDAIESVLRQRYSGFELIIVDDGSVDGTRDVIEHYARQDDRIRAVHHKENKGLAEACNTGLALARHDLIARHDDDDLMLPDRLGQQVEFLRMHPEVSVVSSWVHLIDEAGGIIGHSCPKVDLDRGIAQRIPTLFLEIIHPASMYRRSDVLKVGGYRPVKLEDRDLWGRLATSGYRIAVHPQFVALHRRHSSSLMPRSLKSFSNSATLSTAMSSEGCREMTR